MNVYSGRQGMFRNVVKAFLQQAIGDYFQLLVQSAHLRKVQLHLAGWMEPLEAIHQLPQRCLRREARVLGSHVGMPRSTSTTAIA